MKNKTKLLILILVFLSFSGCTTTRNYAVPELDTEGMGTLFDYYGKSVTIYSCAKSALSDAQIRVGHYSFINAFVYYKNEKPALVFEKDERILEPLVFVDADSPIFNYLESRNSFNAITVAIDGKEYELKGELLNYMYSQLYGILEDHSIKDDGLYPGHELDYSASIYVYFDDSNIKANIAQIENSDTGEICIVSDYVMKALPKEWKNKNFIIKNSELYAPKDEYLNIYNMK